MAFRDLSVGSDLVVYSRQYVAISRLQSFSEILINQKNFGYTILNWLVFYIVGADFQWFLIVVAIISVVPIGFLIYKHSKAPYLSFLLYIALGFYDFSFSGLKQSIALGLVILSYEFVIKRKLKPFLVIVCLAATFHMSALVFIPFYFVVNIKWDKNKILMAISMYALFFVMRSNIANVLTEIYRDSGSSYQATGVVGGKAIAIFIFWMTGLILTKKNSDTTFEFRVLLAAMAISFSLQTFSIYSNNFTRLTFYYFQFAIIYIPSCIKLFIHKVKFVDTRKLLVYANFIVISLTILYYFQYLNGEITPHGILPYKFNVDWFGGW